MVLIIRNFLSSLEMSKLNAFVDDGIEHEWLGPGLDRGKFNYSKRYTSRFYGNNFNYPDIVYDVHSMITDRLSLHKYNKSVLGGGRDGIVVSCTFDGGDVYEHTDPKEEDGLEVLRCNVMTRKPIEGGILFVDGKQINLEEGDLHCYLASDVSHYVTNVSGPRSRVLWMFGYQISKDQWTRILNKDRIKDECKV
jgi:hypothetical protein